MTENSAQDQGNTIEEFPMKIRRTADLNQHKPEGGTNSNTLVNEGNNDPSPSLPSQDRKISWAGVRSQNRKVPGRGLTAENTCQACASGSKRPMYHVGRMSLPLNGKYANNYHRKTNGVHANASPAEGVQNGVQSHLQRSQSGNIYCCGTSLKRVFQERDPEKPWKSKGDYFVAVLTYVLGVGNVVRFPQLCFKHGGGKFNCNNQSQIHVPRTLVFLENS